MRCARAHGRPGTFLPHTWVNAEPVPRFYPNVGDARAPTRPAVAEQRSTVDILLKSNLPGRWAVKDSFNALDLVAPGLRRAARGLVDPQRDARRRRPSSDIVWQRETQGKASAAVRRSELRDVHRPARLRRRRGRHALSRRRRRRTVQRGRRCERTPSRCGASLSLLAATTFPRLPLVGYELGDELQAALEAGFEIGDPLRVWVKARD